MVKSANIGLWLAQKQRKKLPMAGGMCGCVESCRGYVRGSRFSMLQHLRQLSSHIVIARLVLLTFFMKFPRTAFILHFGALVMTVSSPLNG